MTVFTGDTLFVGDIGRIDLRDGEEQPTTLAAALHESLFDKLFRLPAAVRVLPAHGAGSLCGRSISTAPSSTIGEELRSNWAAKLGDRAEFLRRMLANVPDRPAYFLPRGKHMTTPVRSAASSFSDYSCIRE